MNYGLRFVGPAGIITGPLPTEGAWLASYDPDAMAGRGLVTWTTDPAAAARFPSKDAAFAAWQGSPRCNPTRPDGKPNRPLTAYSVTIEELPAPAALAPDDELTRADDLVAIAPEHTPALDQLACALLTVLVAQRGGRVEVPVAELDVMRGGKMAIALDEARATFVLALIRQ